MKLEPVVTQDTKTIAVGRGKSGDGFVVIGWYFTHFPTETFMVEMTPGQTRHLISKLQEKLLPREGEPEQESLL